MGKIRSKTLVGSTLIVTVVLFVVSFASIAFQWNLVKGYSLEALVSPLLLRYTPLVYLYSVLRFTPLGIVFLNEIVYFTNFTLKLLLDLLFLVPYTVAFITGAITVLIHPLSETPGFEKFGEAKNRIRSIITHGPKKQKRVTRVAVLTIIGLYANALLTYILGYTSIPSGDYLKILYIFSWAFIGLGLAYGSMAGVGRLIKQRAEE